MIYFYAFLFGGIFCLIAQFVMDKFKLLPLHLTISFVVIGSMLCAFNFYDRLNEISGAGSLLMISSFGNNLCNGALEGLHEGGILGMFKGILVNSSSVLSFTIIMAFLSAIFFKPRG